jgi:DNA-binding NtrC family response regulator
MARAVHNHGPQREGPFIVFACNAIPNELVVSELVGIEEDFNLLKNVSRPGKIELADGGTIFFKDVEALTLEAQTILINTLELGIVQRLGSRVPVNVAVRVIASSSADLEALVESGSFRPDLYYRLSPFEILIPPLRERLEDLPLLVQNILERINRYQSSPKTAAPETIALLRSYSWPGNIRELEGILERAVASADNAPVLLPQHLPDMLRHNTRPNSKNSTIAPLDEIERQALLNAARVCHGNLTHMARALGIGRTTVWRRLKEMDISLDQYRQS